MGAPSLSIVTATEDINSAVKAAQPGGACSQSEQRVAGTASHRKDRRNIEKQNARAELVDVPAWEINLPGN